MSTRQCPEALALPREARSRFRDGLAVPTGGWSEGFVQANLVSVPRQYADDLRRFTVRNPKPCPLLGAVGAGDYTTDLAFGADLRRDLPAYLVWRRGKLVERRTDVVDVWRDDLVTLLVGCSFTFDPLLERAGIPLRHRDQGLGVPMYRSRLRCTRAGRFRAQMIVSMRPMPAELVLRAARVTANLPNEHGAPVHAGDPAEIGVGDLARPDFGAPVTLAPGDVPVFWACGLTVLEAVVNARPPFAITHEPGHMLITDRRVRGSGPLPVYR